MLTYSSEIFYNNIVHSYKNPKIILCVVFLEFYVIFLETILSAKRVKSYFYDKNFEDSLSTGENTSLNFVNVVDPVYYIRTYAKVDCSDKNQFCNVNFNFLISIFITIISVFFFFHAKSFIQFRHKNKFKEKNKKNSILSFLTKISVNFIDIIFRIFGIFIYLIFMNEIFVYFINSASMTNFVISFIFLLIFTIFYFYQIKYMCLFLVCNNKYSYHYDTEFSASYDYVLMIVKILIVFQKNFIEFGKIIIAKKNNNSIIPIKYIFFDTFLIFLILAYTLQLIYNFYFNHKMLFLINKRLNLFRVSLLIFMSGMIILVGVFNLELNFTKNINLAQFVICLVSIGVFSFGMTFLINEKHHSLILNDDKLIYKMVHLLSALYLYKNKEKEFKTSVYKLQEIHREQCSLKFNNSHSISSSNTERTYCDLCQSDSIEDFFNKMISRVKYLKKTNLITKKEKQIFEYLKLILLNEGLLQSKTSNNENKVFIVYKTRTLLEKILMAESNANFYLNLQFFFTKTKKSNEMNVKKYELIKKYDEMIDMMSNSIESIKEVIISFDMNINKDLYPIAQRLNKNKRKILKNLAYLMTHRSFYVDQYPLIITRFLFEKVFNMQINDNDVIFDFESRNDLLKDHFRGDKMILIRYKTVNSALKVKRASREVYTFRGKMFEDLFPRNMKIVGKDKFVGLVKKNVESFVFEFVVEEGEGIWFSRRGKSHVNKGANIPGGSGVLIQADLFSSSNTKLSSSKNYFLTNVKFNCSIVRSLNMDDVYVWVDYEVTSDDIIVLEQKGNSSKKSVCGFSYSVSKFLFVKPAWLEEVKNIGLEDIFEKEEDLGDSDENVENVNKIKNNPVLIEKPYDPRDKSKGVYVLDYKKYYNLFFKRVMENIQDKIDLEEGLKQKEVEKLANANVRISVKLDLKYEAGPYKIYSFKLINKRDKKKKDVKGEFIQIDNEDDEYSTENDDENMLLEQIRDNTISSSSNNSSIFKEGGGIQVMNSKTKMRQREEANIQRFTKITLWMNIILIIYCVMFLVIGLFGSNKLNQLYKMKNLFINFEHGFYQTSLSLFYNVGINTENTVNETDYITDGYWSRKIHPNITINLGDYANSELQIKLNLLKAKKINLSSFIYGSSFNQIQNIFDFQTTFHSLGTKNGELGVTTHNVNFMESLTMFMNNAETTDFEKTITMIYIFNFDMKNFDYNFGSIFDTNFDSAQKAVYEMIMNYPTFYKNFITASHKIEKLYSEETEKIFNTNFYISFILMILHIFLIIISLMITNYLKKVTKSNNIALVEFFSNETGKYSLNKLSILYEMNNLYKDDPNKLNSDLKKILKERVEKLAKKGRNISHHSENKNENIHIDESEKLRIIPNKNLEFCNSKINIKNLVDPLIILICIVFIIYYIYAVGMYLIFNESYYKLQEFSSFFSRYAKVDNNMMNYITLLQTIMFSNQTDVSLMNYLRDKNYSEAEVEKGYITLLIEETHQHSLINRHLFYGSDLYSEIDEERDTYLDCHLLYNSFSDPIIDESRSSFPGNALKLSLESLCELFPVTKSESFNRLREEVNYTFLKLIKKFNQAFGVYSKMKEVNDEDIFFDAFTLVVLISRPIQTYMINNVITNSALKMEDNYLFIIIIYLICNICADMLIFLIINYGLIRRVNQLNNDVKCLTKCISHH